MAEPPGTLFCADFDHVTAVNQGWTLADVHGDGAGALDTSTFVSPPASFRATAGGADASMPSVYELQFTGSASTATYILELDVRFHASMDTATGVFVATYYPNQGINFYLAQGSLVAAEFPNGPTVTHILPDAFPLPDQWVHLKVAVNAAKLDVFVDGKLELDVAPATAPTAGPRVLHVGLIGSSSQPDSVINYDNVILSAP